uniref:Glycosyltransferases n=1 Tax=Leersia perrieri TaxID=77586 RepID=A0A0D9WAD9_9ORYZ
MKLPLLRPLWPGFAPAANSADAAPEPSKPSLPAAWLLLHALFCATSMAVGFRFSRLIVYLLFLPTPPINPTAHLVSLVSPPAVVLAAGAANATTTITTTTTTTTTTVTTTTVAAAAAEIHHPHHHHGPVFVGRHPIRVRAWPHPDPAELLKAHHILAAVQNAQRSSRRRGAGPTRPFIAVTPTTTSALQVPSLTSMAHTLRLVDGPVTWIVVEHDRRSDAVAAVLSRSGVDFLHISAPDSSTSRLRMHALREIRNRKMDGVVVFADENSILRTELFDEAQKVKSVGAVPVGVLGEDEGASESFLQAPSCDAAGNLVGYHVSDETMLPASRRDMLLSSKLEWAGFVVNANALWEAAHRPEWMRDIAAIDDGAAASPLSLVTDAARVEPLASCGQAALAWSHRSDSLHEVKFPHEWKIEPPQVAIPSGEQAVKPETPLKRTTLLNTEDQH